MRTVHVEHRNIGGNGAAPGSVEPADGLRYPDDPVPWRRWQARNRPLLQRMRALRAPTPTRAFLTLGGSDADVLVASDGSTPSLQAALMRPLEHLEPTRIAVLDHRPRHDVCGADANVHAVDDAAEIVRLLPGLGCTVSIGDHLPLGGLAHRAVRRTSARAFVVQHGLLTPFSPPLPHDVTLLAWSGADATFWRSGRDDVAVEVVGSQLFFDAATAPATPVDPDAPPTFLGQMHAAELSRTGLFRASAGFCRTTGATYRPHPSETDKASRLGHGIMRAMGIRFATDHRPLTELGTPIVAVFSSGVVEAAVANIPAWGHHPDPPAWVVAFWTRYGIARWGTEATPTPPRPEVEPALAIAELLHDTIGPSR